MVDPIGLCDIGNAARYGHARDLTMMCRAVDWSGGGSKAVIRLTMLSEARIPDW